MSFQTEKRLTKPRGSGRGGRPKDLTGARFTKLVAVNYLYKVRRNNYWNCKCDCGHSIILSSKNLLSGRVRSCGCLRAEQLADYHHLRTHGRTKSVEYKLLDGARQRAKKYGREFNLELGDIVVPAVCPVFGIELIKGTGKQHANSPTLDRIDSTRGYTKDNVWVISHKANAFKQDKTVEELEHVAQAIKDKLRRIKE